LFEFVPSIILSFPLTVPSEIFTIIHNNTANQHIRMINEGSCDMDCGFSYAITGVNYTLKYIKIEDSYLKF